jgi:PKD repeat protein
MSISRGVAYKNFSHLRLWSAFVGACAAFLLLLVSIQSVESAPALSLSAPTSSYVNEVVLIDARLSSGISKRPQSDGSPSVTIDFGDGFRANLLATGHAYRAPGTYTITLTGKDAAGATSSIQRTIVVSDIPVATAGNVQFLSDTGNPATNAANLQTAINVAASLNGSSEQEIILPASAVFAGPIVMQVPVGSRYITIRSANLASLPGPGNRVSPSHGPNMPTITAPSSREQAVPAISTPATATASPAHHYRLQGLHIKKDDDLRFSAYLVGLGPQYELDAMSEISHHFIMEHCWVDGGTQDNAYTKDGLRITSNYVSVLDSYFSEFKILTGPDATAISVMVGQGPYAFWNNTLVAGAENFFFGGGGSIVTRGTVSNPTTSSATLSSVADLELDQNIAFKVGGVYSVAQSTIVRSISGNSITFDPIPAPPDNGSTAEWITTPSFCEFRRNYLFKPLKWFPRHPTWNGITYQIKNLWESKQGRYILNDGNVFENSWIADQNYALQISPRNTGGGWSAASVLRELQWSNNIIHNAAAGMRITASDYADGFPSQLTTDVTLRNNLFWNIGNNFDPYGSGHELFGMGNPYGVRMKRIFFIHNTDDNGTPGNQGRAIASFGGNPADSGADETMWLNNVHQDGGYGFFSSTSVNSAINIATYLAPGNATSWNRNLIVNTNGHTYPTAAIIQSAPWASGVFVDYAGGDFTLRPGNPGKNAATDGTDLGVAIGTLKTAIGASASAFGAAKIKVVSGDWRIP